MITASNEGIGRYIHNITADNKYYLIVDSTEGGSADTIVITTGEPDVFTDMASGDDIEIDKEEYKFLKDEDILGIVA